MIVLLLLKIMKYPIVHFLVSHYSVIGMQTHAKKMKSAIVLRLSSCLIFLPSRKNA